MIKDKLIYLLVGFALITTKARAQNPASKSYLILSIEDSFSKGFEGIKKYYWIAETDSIKQSKLVFYPLLLQGFSRANLKKCCEGVAIDPFLVTKADSVFDLGVEYFKECERLVQLIQSQRKLTQEVNKEWQSTNSKELIDFYITPIEGGFCFSEYSKTGSLRTGYTGKIFIPLSSFELDSKFWKSSKSVIVTTHDFYNLDYNVLR